MAKEPANLTVVALEAVVGLASRVRVIDVPNPLAARLIGPTERALAVLPGQERRERFRREPISLKPTVFEIALPDAGCVALCVFDIVPL